MTPKITTQLVNQAYVAGTREYYAGQTPDPWQAAHTVYEGSLSITNEKIRTYMAKDFVHKCITLSGEYKRSREVAPHVDISLMVGQTVVQTRVREIIKMLEQINKELY